MYFYNLMIHIYFLSMDIIVISPSQLLPLLEECSSPWSQYESTVLCHTFQFHPKSIKNNILKYLAQYYRGVLFEYHRAVLPIC